MKDALREAADMPAHKWWSVGGGFNAELQRVAIVVMAISCTRGSRRAYCLGEEFFQSLMALLAADEWHVLAPGTPP